MNKTCGTCRQMKRADMPWCDVPESVTVDEILQRLNQATTALCTCGGRGPGEGGCDMCRIWHFVLGRTEATQ